MTKLPDGWAPESLSDVCLPVTKADPVSTGREQVRYVDIGSVDGARHRLPEIPWVASESAPSRCRQIIAGGDTVFSTVRPYLEKIAFIDGSLDGEFASTGFCVLRPGPKLLPRYLFHFSVSHQMLDQVLIHQRGVSYPAVLDKVVKAATIPLPTLGEQQRIVDILEDHLSRLDAGATSVEAAVRRLIALRRSALNALFSGANYPRVPLRELVVGIEAGRSFGGSSHPASDDEWGIIKVSAMTWGTFRANENKAIASDRSDARYEINKGDLLISRANTTAYVGAAVLVGEVRPRLLLSDKSLRILAAPGVEREWLWRALSAPDARSQMSAAATGTKDSMRNISQPALLNIELSAVPVADQKAAVAISLEVETGIQRLAVDLESAAVRGERLRHALLGAAFSGRLTGRTTDMETVEEMAGV